MKGYIFITDKGLYITLGAVSSHSAQQMYHLDATPNLNNATLFKHATFEQNLKSRPLKDPSQLKHVGIWIVQALPVEEMRTLTILKDISQFPEDPLD
jgi:hypothetical protein